MTLYIEQYYSADKKAPGKIILHLPNFNGGETKMAGFLLAEPTFSSSNKWGTILGDVSSDLNDLQSLLGTSNMFSWVGASVQCWKGTDPLRFNADFFVVNYAPTLDLESKIKSLMALSSLDQGDYLEAVTVKIHGGYEPKVLVNNEEQATFNGDNGVINNEYNKSGQTFADPNHKEPGTVWVEIGEKISLAGLLVQSVNVTPSLTEVCSVNGENVKPLYYKLNVSFIGHRALLKSDVDNFIQ